MSVYDALKNGGRVLVYVPTSNHRLTLENRGVNLITLEQCKFQIPTSERTHFILMVEAGMKPAEKDVVRIYAEKHGLTLNKFTNFVLLNQVIAAMWGRADKGPYVPKVYEKIPPPEEKTQAATSPTSSSTPPRPAPPPVEPVVAAPAPKPAPTPQPLPIAEGIAGRNLEQDTRREGARSTLRELSKFVMLVEGLAPEMLRLGIPPRTYAQFRKEVIEHEQEKRRALESL